jgi:hypothetical protein
VRQGQDPGTGPLQCDRDEGSIPGAGVSATAKPTLTVAGGPSGDAYEELPARQRPGGLFQVVRDLGHQLERAAGLRVRTVATKASGTARVHIEDVPKTAIGTPVFVRIRTHALGTLRRWTGANGP